jgi:hypothetical protein
LAAWERLSFGARGGFGLVHTTSVVVSWGFRVDNLLLSWWEARAAHSNSEKGAMLARAMEVAWPMHTCANIALLSKAEIGPIFGPTRRFYHIGIINPVWRVAKISGRTVEQIDNATEP